MSPVYIQHLLTVLLEEYEDIGYMLDSLDHQTTPAQRRLIRNLLGRLDQENHALLKRLPAPARMTPLSQTASRTVS